MVNSIMKINSIKSFFKWINEQNHNIIVTGFLRTNPPTIGHFKLFKKAGDEALKYKTQALMFFSHSQDPKKNPLTYDQKIYYLNKVKNMPSNVKVIKSSLNNPFQIVADLAKTYKEIYIIAGSDRLQEYSRLQNYVPDGVKVSVVSSGERDPDSNGVSGISASLVRKYASEGKESEFLKSVPFDPNTAKQLYKDVRSGMGIR